MSDINKLTEQVYDALTQSEVDGYDQWDDEVSDVVFDLLTFNKDFSDVPEDDLRRAVVGAMIKHG